MGLRVQKTNSGATENVLEGNPRSATTGRAQVELWVNYFYDCFIQNYFYDCFMTVVFCAAHPR